MIEKLSVAFVPEFLVYKRITCRQGWEIKNWFILSHAYRHSKTLCFMGSLQKCFFFFFFCTHCFWHKCAKEKETAASGVCKINVISHSIEGILSF